MKKNTFFASVLFSLIMGLSLITANVNGQTITGIDLPAPCTNCDDCTTFSSKEASTLGIATQATDSAAFASGKGSIASGMYSTALGYYNQANNHSAFAAGYMSIADSSYSVALGYKATAAGLNAVAIGTYVKATAPNSIVIGRGLAPSQTYLTNNISNSIVLGMATSSPTMIISGSEFVTSHVGIKTTNPTADLDVNGSLKTVSFQLTQPAQTGYVLKSDASGNASWADPHTLGIWNLNGTSAYYNSNVGIGTSNPTANLDVNGSLKTVSFQLTQSAQTGYVLQSDASGNASWADPHTLGIWNLNGTNAYYNSNVGIGTTTPTAKLEVAGTLKTQQLNVSGGVDGYILKSDANGNATWSNPAELSYWGLNAQSKLVTDKSAGILITQGQDVFGTFQIGDEFTFWGSGTSDNKIIANNYKWDSGGKRIHDGAVSTIILHDASGNISFNTSGTGMANTSVDVKSMIFTAEGKLGVGIVTPLHTLDVYASLEADASIRSSSASKSILWTSNSLRSFGFGVDASGMGHIYRSASEDNLMTFTADGKVLIGDNTNTPGSHKLYVNGSILTEEVTIAEVSAWSDFVFDTDYDLPGLDEVKSFINQNGHLPGVPSADEVKQKGINLAETDAMLLQKIEELTLYILQQDKKINALQETIEKLSAQE